MRLEKADTGWHQPNQDLRLAEAEAPDLEELEMLNEKRLHLLAKLRAIGELDAQIDVASREIKLKKQKLAELEAELEAEMRNGCPLCGRKDVVA